MRMDGQKYRGEIKRFSLPRLSENSPYKRGTRSSCRESFVFMRRALTHCVFAQLVSFCFIVRINLSS